MKNAIRTALAACALLPTAALATTGYFSHGYGLKAKGMGMGGVGIALPQDALAPATNPAGLGGSSATVSTPVWTGSGRSAAAKSPAVVCRA